MADQQITPEVIAEAISLKVLADAPDSRGPFVLEVRHGLDGSELRRIQDIWNQVFEKAGRDAPVLLILADGVTLRAATEQEREGGHVG